MAVFSREINNCSKKDWSILINGGISLYHDVDILQKDLYWLENNQYKHVILNFESIECIEIFHKKIKSACAFPEYYGENMSAFSDCLLHDLDIPYEGGISFVLKKFNSFYKKEQTMAHEILERLSEASRRRILTGERIVTLLHSDDPLFSPDQIGAFTIRWNIHEFAEAKRIKQ